MEILQLMIQGDFSTYDSWRFCNLCFIKILHLMIHKDFTTYDS